MKPLPPSVADSTYAKVLSKFQIEDSLHPNEQLDKLLALDVEQILSIGPDVPLLPVIDGELVKANITFEQWKSALSSKEIAGTQWCRRVMLGDCQFDVGRKYSLISDMWLIDCIG